MKSNKTNSTVNPKKIKEKKYILRNFFLELKRVRWVKNQKLNKTFLEVLAFVITSTIFVGIVVAILHFIWMSIGIGSGGK